LDNLEEHRDLSLEEWNFRGLVTQQLQSLLNQQRIYWQQRGTIKWVKFGDDCIRFFHANASIKHCRNTISTLRDDSGKELVDHEEKARHIWLSFKERMDISEYSNMSIDLASLITPSSDLQWLEGEFLKEEID
jgi:hypothetical protein